MKAAIPSLTYFAPSTPSPSVVSRDEVDWVVNVFTNDGKRMWYDNKGGAGSFIIDLGAVMPINRFELCRFHLRSK